MVKIGFSRPLTDPQASAARWRCTMKVKKVSIIDHPTAYDQGLAEEFAKVAKANGIQVVRNNFTNDKVTDFTAILTSIKSHKPDTIFYGGYSP